MNKKIETIVFTQYDWYEAPFHSSEELLRDVVLADGVFKTQVELVARHLVLFAIAITRFVSTRAKNINLEDEIL